MELESSQEIADWLLLVLEELSARWLRHSDGTTEEQMMCEGYLQAIGLLTSLSVAEVRRELETRKENERRADAGSDPA